MKETGLMFKAPLVRSILDGSKTQTRRVVPFRTLQLIEYGSIAGECHELPSAGTLHPNSVDYYNSFCSMGQPGDRIYVREAWAPNTGSAGGFLYRANHGGAASFNRFDLKTGICTHSTSRWWPSIHMPKHAARIWLDITSVRVERLQDISEADCIAEGISELPHQAAERGCWWTGNVAAGAALHGRTPRNAFQLLWESTGGDWAANPWVWVIDFKRDLAQKGQP